MTEKKLKNINNLSEATSLSDVKYGVRIAVGSSDGMTT